jgi:hypothetical protein
MLGGEFNTISGEILQDKTVLCTLTGRFDREIFIKDVATKERVLCELGDGGAESPAQRDPAGRTRQI